MDNLTEKEPENLYEILLIYNKHFIKPINQNLEFLNNFIGYTIKNKKFDIFKIGLNYIKDIEAFISVIKKNKEDIFNTYIVPDNDSKKNDKYYVEIGKKLKFKKTENNEENEDEQKAGKKEGEKEVQKDEDEKDKLNKKSNETGDLGENSNSISLSGSSEYEIIESNYTKTKNIKSNKKDYSYNNNKKNKRYYFFNYKKY